MFRSHSRYIPNRDHGPVARRPPNQGRRGFRLFGVGDARAFDVTGPDWGARWWMRFTRGSGPPPRAVLCRRIDLSNVTDLLLSHAGAEKTGFTIPVGTAVSKRLNRSPAIDLKDDTGHERGLVRDK